MELRFNEMVGLHQERTQCKFIDEIQMHFLEKQADIRRKVANFENFVTKLSSVLTSRTQIEPQLEKSIGDYPEKPISNLEIIKTQEKTDVFQSLSKFTEDDIHYFARPTIDRIFNVQKILQEEYNLESDEDMKLNKDLDERESDSKEGRLARELLPDPQSPKKIENSPIHERRKISKSSANILKNWLLDHIDDPYPSKQEKSQLAQDTKLSFKQVQNWFINARGRGWKQLLKREKFSREVEKKLLDTNSIALKALMAKEYV